MKRSPRSPQRRRSPAPQAESTEPEPLRLARYLAMCGVDARRSCEELITAGRVVVDRETVTDPAFKVNPAQHDVRLDGEKIVVRPRAYYILNKPTGYLCTNADPMGRKRAVDLLPTNQGRLFSVGRLDENSQGLLVVTNDGDLAERLAHPRYAVPKVYHVLVAGIPEPKFAEKLVRGMRFDEGIFRVRSARLLKAKGQSAIVEITLTEGQNREIRRLLARLGHKVMQLERVALGPLKLGGMPVGAYRPLERHELAQLLALMKKPAVRRERPSREDRRARFGGGGKSGSADAIPEASALAVRRPKPGAGEEAADGRPAAPGKRPSGDRARRDAGRPGRGRPQAGSRPGEGMRPGRTAGRPRPPRGVDQMPSQPRAVVETDEGDTMTPAGLHPAIVGGGAGRAPRESIGTDATNRRPPGGPRGKRPANKGRRRPGGKPPGKGGGRMAAQRPRGKRKES